MIISIGGLEPKKCEPVNHATSNLLTESLLVTIGYYTPIAFDERVTFWLQRAGSLPCACVFAALYACAIV